MLRISSRRFCADVAITALLLLTSIAAFGQSTTGQSVPVQSLSNSSSGQSLGDIARANQEKKAAEASGTTPKVITNSDLPKNPDEDPEQPANQNQNSAGNPASAAASRKAAHQRVAEERAGAQWRQQILAQKGKVAILQARCDRLRAQIHFVNPGYPYSSDNTTGSTYNGQESRMMERLHEMEDQLNQEKQKLERLQEAARHAGMHTTVYDP
jgi:hypothetical protein